MIYRTINIYSYFGFWGQSSDWWVLCLSLNVHRFLSRCQIDKLIYTFEHTSCRRFRSRNNVFGLMNLIDSIVSMVWLNVYAWLTILPIGNPSPYLEIIFFNLWGLDLKFHGIQTHHFYDFNGFKSNSKDNNHDVPKGKILLCQLCISK